MRVFLHLMLSFFLAFLGFLACPVAASIGVPQVLYVWLLSAKIIAPIISVVVPATWIYGSPNDEAYWPQVSGGGFVILCALAFWVLLLFVLLELRHHYRKTGSLTHHSSGTPNGAP